MEEYHHYNLSRTPTTEICGDIWTSTSFSKTHDDDDEVVNGFSIKNAGAGLTKQVKYEDIMKTI